MFTGLVEACAAVRRVEPRGEGIRLWVAAPGPWNGEVQAGSSLAVSGACLTLVEARAPDESPRESALDLGFDVSSETLARTWFAELAPDRKVNLERAVRLGDRLDGHLVAGHVDGLARIAAIEDTRDGGRLFRFEVVPALERYLVDKGSVTLEDLSAGPAMAKRFEERTGIRVASNR